jgi:peptidyl-prolyl cis-trans isomerase D
MPFNLKWYIRSLDLKTERMATLERIRRRSGLLIIVIGLAMAAFILTDLLGSGGMLFTDYNSVGEINGKKITREEFAIRMEKLVQSNQQYSNFSTKMQADFVWNQILREELLGKEYNKLGMSITSEELFYDLVNNPQVRQIQLFQDQSGQFSESAFRQGMSYLVDNKDNEPQLREFWDQWIAFEQSVKDQSLVFKYNNAVEKGLYTPQALARADHVASTQTYAISFIQMPYSAIVDSTLAVTEAEKKAYYNANKEDFTQEAVRNIEYVDFAIMPSEADRNEIKMELADLIEDRVTYNTTTGTNDTTLQFANTENDSAFVSMYSDQPVDMNYVGQAGGLPPILDTVLFDAEVGTIIGPYEEAGGFKLSKLSDIKYLPDSVKARHILIAYQGAERSQATRPPFEAKQLADSLFEVIQGDVSMFDSISRAYSDDLVAAGKGGDLGWFSQGQMAVPFNNYCFYNDVGDLGLVITNFGFHIIEITDQKGSNKSVRVASIFRGVDASEETRTNVYREASTFASEAQSSDDFRALAEEKGYQLRPATNIAEFDENIPGLGQSRKIVQWAWNKEREEGAIGLIDNNNQGYVVVILTDKLEEGYAPMDKVMGRVTQGARDLKKGEQLVAQIAEAAADETDINAIAAKLNTTVKTQSINRKTAALTGAGNEPVVIGKMLALPPNVLSEPVAGERAAYLFTVTSINDAFEKPDYSEEIANLQQAMRSRVASESFESIREQADITDRRALIY